MRRSERLANPLHATDLGVTSPSTPVDGEATFPSFSLHIAGFLDATDEAEPATCGCDWRMPATVLKELLGHARIETTMVYLRRKNKAAAMEAVRDLSWGASVFPANGAVPPTGFEPVLGEDPGESGEPRSSHGRLVTRSGASSLLNAARVTGEDVSPHKENGYSCHRDIRGSVRLFGVRRPCSTLRNLAHLTRRPGVASSRMVAPGSVLRPPSRIDGLASRRHDVDGRQIAVLRRNAVPHLYLGERRRGGASVVVVATGAAVPGLAGVAA